MHTNRLYCVVYLVIIHVKVKCSSWMWLTLATSISGNSSTSPRSFSFLMAFSRFKEFRRHLPCLPVCIVHIWTATECCFCTVFHVITSLLEWPPGRQVSLPLFKVQWFVIYLQHNKRHKPGLFKDRPGLCFYRITSEIKTQRGGKCEIGLLDMHLILGMAIYSSCHSTHGSLQVSSTRKHSVF